MINTYKKHVDYHIMNIMYASADKDIIFITIILCYVMLCYVSKGKVHSCTDNDNDEELKLQAYMIMEEFGSHARHAWSLITISTVFIIYQIINNPEYKCIIGNFCVIYCGLLNFRYKLVYSIVGLLYKP